MKRRSPQFHFLSASPATTTLMDNRLLIRGCRNYGGRGYSSSSSDGRGRGHYVNGDTLYQSMREENLGFRQGNNSGFEPSFFNPRAPPSNQNYGLRRPSLYSQRPQYWQPRPFVPNQQLPPFDHNHGVRTPHQFRPRFPKPLDFRNWEYAKTPPPPDSQRFTILSYNILADYLAINHRSKLYFHIPHYMMEWGWRKRNINFELGLWSADIMCFQEVDRFPDLGEELNLRGYNGIWKMRTGTPTDGCAIFWRTSRFKLLHEESIEFNKLGLRDNVAQICVFELIKQNINENAAVAPTSLQKPNRVVICNVHVLYNPKRGEIKLGQIRILLSKAHAVSELWNDAPVVLCGDFNCTPKSALYNFISDQKLDISGLGRDNVSGQASAEIHATPPHHLNPRYIELRVEPGNNSTQSEDSKEVNCGDCPLDSKKNSGNRGNSLPSMINSHPTWSNGVQNVDIVLQNEVKTESQSYSTNFCKDESDSSVYCLDERFREGSNSSFAEAKFPDRDNNLGKCSNSSYVEDKFSIHYTNDTVHEVNPSELIYSDKFCTNLTEGKSGVTVDTPCFSNPGDEHFESNMDIVDKHLSEVRIHPETANSFTSTISSLEFSNQVSFSDHVKPSTPGRPQNLSSHLTNESEKGSSSSVCMDNASCASISINFGVNEKLESSCLKKLVSNPADETIVEDDSTFFSALHNAEDPFTNELESDNTKDFDPVSHESLLHEPLQGLDSENFAVAQTIYEPSLWTPMDIETATGSSDCTVLEHSLKLRSTYAEVEDFSGSRDMNGEPLVTSYNRCFLGTVDYIWRSEGLQTVKVLAPIPKHAMQWTPGFPTKKWGSDHIALVSELAFMNEAINKTEC